MLRALGLKLVADNHPGSRWSANENNDQCWLELDLGKPTKISTVMIDERAWNRVSKFNLAYKVNNDWKTIFEGTNIGMDFARDFDPVLAQSVRLNIFDTREGMGFGPTIWEISLGTVQDGRAWIALPRPTACGRPPSRWISASSKENKPYGCLPPSRGESRSGGWS